MTHAGKTAKSPMRTRSTRSAQEPDAEPKTPSPTAIAAEALATGVVPLRAGRRQTSEIPGQDEMLRVGDPDDHPLENAFVGDETPGGDTPTPDQNLVDSIGRAYGVAEEDSGSLRTSSEILDRRDQHRTDQDAPDPRDAEVAKTR